MTTTPVFDKLPEPFFIDVTRKNPNIQTYDDCINVIEETEGFSSLIYIQPELLIPKVLTHEQYIEICLIAVKKEGLNLKDIKPEYQTYEICMEAVKESPFALYCVKDEYHTAELYRSAVKRDRIALQYIKKQTTPEGIELYKELFDEALKQDNKAITYVQNQSDDLYRELALYVFKRDPYSIKHIKKDMITPNMAQIAIREHLNLLNEIDKSLIKSVNIVLSNDDSVNISYTYNTNNIDEYQGVSKVIAKNKYGGSSTTNMRKPITNFIKNYHNIGNITTTVNNIDANTQKIKKIRTYYEQHDNVYDVYVEKNIAMVKKGLLYNTTTNNIIKNDKICTYEEYPEELPF